MTYLEFLIYFLIIPLSLTTLLFRKSKLPHKKEFKWGLAVLVLLAVIYTTPWDNYLVATDVWSYGPERVVGTIGYVPVEEYAFFVLQTLLTGSFCFLLQKKYPLTKEAVISKIRPIVTGTYVSCFLFGLYALTQVSMTYLGLILVWAIPILLLQWLIGGAYLLRNARIFLATFLIPTIYLWFADALAIYLGIWDISKTYTMGINVGVLPIEEATFFLVTNLMVAQGLLLFIVMEEHVKKIIAYKTKLLS